MTWYVHRRADQSVASRHREVQPGYAEEALADDAPEMAALDKALLPSYRARRAVAYRDRLGVETGDFVKTLGDVLDTMIAELRARGASSTPAFQAMVAMIDTIKSAIPKAP